MLFGVPCSNNTQNVLDAKREGGEQSYVFSHISRQELVLQKNVFIFIIKADKIPKNL